MAVAVGLRVFLRWYPRTQRLSTTVGVDEGGMDGRQRILSSSIDLVFVDKLQRQDVDQPYVH